MLPILLLNKLWFIWFIWLFPWYIVCWHSISTLYFLYLTRQVQLTVTPKVEGALQLVGVRWKLSGSVIGFCNFQSDIVRKKVAKGKRKPKKSVKDNLEFLVIKVSLLKLLLFWGLVFCLQRYNVSATMCPKFQSLPRLEGTIHSLPRTVHTGDLRCLTMELRNPSKTPVKV